jgi:23S rRNA (uracil1939-C5)-methyltransferase
MHESAFDAISLLTPKEIIYVSCNPSTLVRDVDILMRQGRYAITSIQPVDMFPHTHHIETIVRLERN